MDETTIEAGTRFEGTHESGALFSDDGTYRYLLWRNWLDTPPATFILLNPSTADEIDNDPTVARCQKRAEMWGHGGVMVANLFALRSTSPKELYHHDDPIGPANDVAIQHAAAVGSMVMCGWGNHGALYWRSRHVLWLLQQAGVMTKCLGLTKAGEPIHPLYVAYDKPLWNVPDVT